MFNSKPVSTLLAPGVHLIKVMKAGHKDVNSKLYQGIVGSIMYGMLCMCPNLAFTIQQLLQFTSDSANAYY